MSDYGTLTLVKKNGKLGHSYVLKKNELCTIGSFGSIRMCIENIQGVYCVIKVKKSGVAIITNKTPKTLTKLNGKCFNKPKCLKHEDVITVGTKTILYRNTNVSNEKVQKTENKIAEKNPKASRKSMFYVTKRVPRKSMQRKAKLQPFNESIFEPERNLKTPLCDGPPPDCTNFATPENNTSLVLIESPIPEEVPVRSKKIKSLQSKLSTSLCSMNSKTPKKLIKSLLCGEMKTSTPAKKKLSDSLTETFDRDVSVMSDFTEESMHGSIRDLSVVEKSRPSRARSVSDLGVLETSHRNSRLSKSMNAFGKTLRRSRLRQTLNEDENSSGLHTSHRKSIPKKTETSVSRKSVTTHSRSVISEVKSPNSTTKTETIVSIVQESTITDTPAENARTRNSTKSLYQVNDTSTPVKILKSSIKTRNSMSVPAGHKLLNKYRASMPLKNLKSSLLDPSTSRNKARVSFVETASFCADAKTPENRVSLNTTMKQKRSSTKRMPVTPRDETPVLNHSINSSMTSEPSSRVGRGCKRGRESCSTNSIPAKRFCYNKSSPFTAVEERLSKSLNFYDTDLKSTRKPSRRSLPSTVLFNDDVDLGDTTWESVDTSSIIYIPTKDRSEISPSTQDGEIFNESIKSVAGKLDVSEGSFTDSLFIETSGSNALNEDSQNVSNKSSSIVNEQGGEILDDSQLRKSIRVKRPTFKALSIGSKRAQNEPKNDLSSPRGVKKLLRTPKVQKQPRNDLSSPKGIKKLLKTPRPQKEPLNDLSSPRGVKRLMKTPKVQKQPLDDLSSPKGVKKLLKTPRPQKAPLNDLRSPRGVKQLMKTPKVQKQPLNDLSSPKGVKKLLKTPRPQKAPLNDLRSPRGVKQLMKTPKVQKQPLNDLSSPRGVKRLMKTPKLQKEPLNDLSSPKGIKKLMKIQKVQKPPRDDLSSPRGVKKLMKTPKVQKEPLNDLTSPRGVKQLMRTPKIQKQPLNDLSSPKGVKKLMKIPKVQKQPRNDLSSPRGVKQLLKTPKIQKEPLNDLTSPRGVKQLMKTPKEQNQPLNDLSSPKGVKKLFKTTKSQNNPKNDLSDVEGVCELFKTQTPLRTYGRKSGSQLDVSPVEMKWMALKEENGTTPTETIDLSDITTPQTAEVPKRGQRASIKQDETVENKDVEEQPKRGQRASIKQDKDETFENKDVEEKPKRGQRTSIKQDNDETVENKDVEEKPKRGRRAAATKQEEAKLDNEKDVVESKRPVRTRRAAVKKSVDEITQNNEDKEQGEDNVFEEKESKRPVRGRRAAAAKKGSEIPESGKSTPAAKIDLEEPVLKEDEVEVKKPVRGRRAAAKKSVKETETSIAENNELVKDDEKKEEIVEVKPARGRRAAAKKTVDIPENNESPIKEPAKRGRRAVTKANTEESTETTAVENDAKNDEAEETKKPVRGRRAAVKKLAEEEIPEAAKEAEIVDESTRPKRGRRAAATKVNAEETKKPPTRGRKANAEKQEAEEKDTEEESVKPARGRRVAAKEENIDEETPVRQTKLLANVLNEEKKNSTPKRSARRKVLEATDENKIDDALESSGETPVKRRRNAKAAENNKENETETLPAKRGRRAAAVKDAEETPKRAARTRTKKKEDHAEENVAIEEPAVEVAKRGRRKKLKTVEDIQLESLVAA